MECSDDNEKQTEPVIHSSLNGKLGQSTRTCFGDLCSDQNRVIYDEVDMQKCQGSVKDCEIGEMTNEEEIEKRTEKATKNEKRNDTKSENCLEESKCRADKQTWTKETREGAAQGWHEGL
jgi:hypothetical protein